MEKALKLTVQKILAMGEYQNGRIWCILRNRIYKVG